MEKKLYRVMEGKSLCGVCTGLAKYFSLDVTIIRVLWIVITLAGGAGLLAYIICALVIPEEPTQIIEPEHVEE